MLISGLGSIRIVRKFDLGLSFSPYDGQVLSIRVFSAGGHNLNILIGLDHPRRRDTISAERLSAKIPGWIVLLRENFALNKRAYRK